jgi:uncharacterized membrane protein
MINLLNIGRIFYGIAIAGIGFQTIYYHDFPYMVLPPNHLEIPGITMFAYIFGAMLILAGACIFFEKKTRLISLLLGSVLLLIFCFYFIPYEFIASSNYMHFGEWENAAKELALASGAFTIAGNFPQIKDNRFIDFLSKLIPFGTIFFSITIISFSMDHFLYANAAADYVPSWIPYHLFWIYFAGIALLGAGVAIILKIKRRLIATLLGTMIFTWFIILHIPKAIDAPFADMGEAVTSAFLALAYSGIAFVIAGGGKNV